jgi:hypothetical protein
MEESNNFYKDLGFIENALSETMYYFKIAEKLGFIYKKHS